MTDPHMAAKLRIMELEEQLRTKEMECFVARRDRHQDLQEKQFRERLAVAAIERRRRGVFMDTWSSDYLAGWFQEIGLADCCSLILTHG